MKSRVWMLKQDEMMVTFMEAWQDITLRVECTWHRDLSCLMMLADGVKVDLPVHNLFGSSSSPFWPLTICIWGNWNGCPKPSSQSWTSIMVPISDMPSNMDVVNVRCWSCEIQTFDLLYYVCHICTISISFSSSIFGLFFGGFLNKKFDLLWAIIHKDK